MILEGRRRVIPCNIRREGGESLVITREGGESLVLLEGREENPL